MINNFIIPHSINAHGKSNIRVVRISDNTPIEFLDGCELEGARYAQNNIDVLYYVYLLNKMFPDNITVDTKSFVASFLNGIQFDSMFLRRLIIKDLDFVRLTGFYGALRNRPDILEIRPMGGGMYKNVVTGEYYITDATTTENSYIETTNLKHVFIVTGSGKISYDADVLSNKELADLSKRHVSRITQPIAPYYQPVIGKDNDSIDRIVTNILRTKSVMLAGIYIELDAKAVVLNNIALLTDLVTCYYFAKDRDGVVKAVLGETSKYPYRYILNSITKSVRHKQLPFIIYDNDICSISDDGEVITAVNPNKLNIEHKVLGMNLDSDEVLSIYKEAEDKGIITSNVTDPLDIDTISNVMYHMFIELKQRTSKVNTKHTELREYSIEVAILDILNLDVTIYEIRRELALEIKVVPDMLTIRKEVLYTLQLMLTATELIEVIASINKVIHQYVEDYNIDLVTYSK